MLLRKIVFEKICGTAKRKVHVTCISGHLCIFVTLNNMFLNFFSIDYMKYCMPLLAIFECTDYAMLHDVVTVML